MRATGFAASLLTASIACSENNPVVVVEVTGIAFVVQPAADVAAGDPLMVSVELRGADGQRAESARDQVMLTVAAGYGVVGPSTVAAVRGLATFNGVVVTSTGNDAQFTATSGQLSASSNYFIVRAGAPDALTSTVEPAALSVPPNESSPMLYTLRDRFGNLIASSPVSFSTTMAGATFSPASGTTSVSGTFAMLFRAPAPGSAPVSATVGTHTAVLRPAFSVCAPAALQLPGLSNGSVSVGQCYAGGRPSALFNFTQDGPGALSLAVTSAFAAVLEIKTDPPADNIAVAATQGTPIDWLLPAGTFQARVSALSGGGNFDLTTGIVPGNSGCQRRYITTSGTYTGQALWAGDCDLGDGSYYDAFGVYSSRPCSIRLQSSQFTRFVWLYDEFDAGPHASAFAEDPGQDAVLGLPACKYLGRPIFLWVNAYPGESGSYTLTVTFFDPPPGAAPDTLSVVPAAPVTRAVRSAGAIAEMRRAIRGRNRP